MPQPRHLPVGVIGPLGNAITVDVLTSAGGLPTANSLSILRRCLVVEDGAIDDGPVRAWAVRTALGQDRALLRAVDDRRINAARSLTRSDTQARQVILRCDGPLLTGVGEGGVRDVGIAVHGTFGWPVLPASTLKGVTHAYARDEAGMSVDDRVILFGGPRPDSTTERVGSVTFLDGLPLDVVVSEHVLTPHLREYYGDAVISEDDNHIDVKEGIAPAEYFNPKPVSFLAIDRGTFSVVLLGPPEPVTTVESLLTEAVKEIGLGAKTAAGYGYLKPEKGKVL